jgi:hypothetical protein
MCVHIKKFFFYPFLTIKFCLLLFLIYIVHSYGLIYHYLTETVSYFSIEFIFISCLKRKNELRLHMDAGGAAKKLEKSRPCSDKNECV